MNDPVSTARTARENLARGLAALQAPGVPAGLMDVAEPVADAMSALHRVESTHGAALAEAAPAALQAVRRALGMLQAQQQGSPGVDQAVEAIAGSLSLVHTLNQMLLQPAAAPAAAAQALGGTVVLPDPYASPATQPSAQAPYAAGPYAPPAAQGFAAQAPQAGYAQPANPMHAAPGMAAQAPQAGFPQHAAPTANYGPPPVAPQAQPAYGAPAAAAPWPGAAPAQQAPPWTQQQQPGMQQPAMQQPAMQQPAMQQPAMPMQHAPQGSAPHHAAPGPGSAPHHAAPAADQPAYRAPPDAVRVEAELGAHSATNFYKGLSGNDVIDSGGIFIATYMIPKIGQNLVIKVSLPGGYEFESLGVVSWTRDAPHSTGGAEVPPGFGARFTQISPEGRQLIYRYVRNREPLFHDDL